MVDTPIDFWSTMGSTYSYLSVMRLSAVERSTWHPVSLAVVPSACHYARR